VQSCRQLPRVADAGLAAYARDDRHLEMMREIGTRSVAAVATPGAERIVGTITLGTAESGRMLGEDEPTLTEEQGRRRTPPGLGSSAVGGTARAARARAPCRARRGGDGGRLGVADGGDVVDDADREHHTLRGSRAGVASARASAAWPVARST
jgi:hypothetical protein